MLYSIQRGNRKNYKLKIFINSIKIIYIVWKLDYVFMSKNTIGTSIITI